MSSGGCGVTTSAIELQDGKRYHYNVFFRAVFEARNVGDYDDYFDENDKEEWVEDDDSGARRCRGSVNLCR